MVVKSLRVRAPGYAGCSGSASMRGCWKGEVTAREVGHDGQGKKFSGLLPIATPLSKEWSAALLKRESLCQKVMDLKSNEHERTSVKE